MKEFPQEKYIDLENNPYLVGRLTIHLVKDSFHVEVDIIYKESHKIFRHVDIIYHQNSSHEAMILGVQRMRKFLDHLEKDQSSREKRNIH
jgi:hypothetical protein